MFISSVKPKFVYKTSFVCIINLWLIFHAIDMDLKSRIWLFLPHPYWLLNEALFLLQFKLQHSCNSKLYILKLIPVQGFYAFRCQYSHTKMNQFIIHLGINTNIHDIFYLQWFDVLVWLGRKTTYRQGFYGRHER